MAKCFILNSRSYVMLPKLVLLHCTTLHSHENEEELNSYTRGIIFNPWLTGNDHIWNSWVLCMCLCVFLGGGWRTHFVRNTLGSNLCDSSSQKHLAPCWTMSQTHGFCFPKGTLHEDLVLWTQWEVAISSLKVWSRRQDWVSVAEILLSSLLKVWSWLN